MNMLPAYKGKIDNEHIICMNCPDSAEAEQAVRRVEWMKEIDKLLVGVTDYIQSKIKLVASCKDCVK